MPTTVVLDLLLALIIVLFVPIGAWRGAAKEAVVAAGILLGAAIAAAWAAAWGDELAGLLPTGAATTRFWVAVAIVLFCAVTLGYGGGAALGPLRPGWGGRLAGGLLAGLNGALLVALALTFIERYLLAGESIGALDDGPLAWALLHRFDWLLVGAALVLLPWVAVGVFLNPARNRDPVLLPPVPPADATADRLRPVRVPNAADAGKFEPTASDLQMWPVRSATTEVGPAVSLTPATPTWPDPPRPAGDRSNGNGSRPGSRFAPGRAAPTNGATGTPVAEEWLRRASAMTRPAEADDPNQRTRAISGAAPPDWAQSPARTVAPSADDTSSERPADLDQPIGQTAWVWPSVFDGSGLDAPIPAPDGSRCLTCGAPVKPSDVFCADCGAAI